MSYTTLHYAGLRCDICAARETIPAAALWASVKVTDECGDAMVKHICPVCIRLIRRSKELEMDRSHYCAKGGDK